MNCAFITILAFCCCLVQAIPSTSSNSILKSTLEARGVRPRTADPYFPDQPPSCQLCAQAWPSIDSCCDAAPLFENFTSIILNPVPFIDLIECACTDTFKSAFPQCVDCFQMTNQTDVLQSDDLPGVISGMRTVCGMMSTLIGSVASTNRQLPSQTPITVTPNAAAANSLRLSQPGFAPAVITCLVGIFVGFRLLL